MMSSARFSSSPGCTSRQEWNAARASLQEVITIRERQPDRKVWRIGDAQRALADLDHRATLDLSQRQRLQEADRLFRVVNALHRQGKHKEGIDPCRKAMEIRAELLGMSHPDYATSLYNLAALYEGMGDHARAEELYRQALDIRKRVLGENHPDYATGLSILASLYDSKREHAKAEPLHRRALETTKRARARTIPTLPPA